MTSKEWKKYKLGEIADINMGQSPKSEYYNTLGDGIAFLQGNRTFGFKNPAFDTYTTLATKTAQAGDVIMSVRAPVGDLNITPINICIGRGLCSIRMKNNNQEFLYYLMKYCVSNLINRESGTVFGSVNRNDISSLEINVPCDDILQRKIAKVLSAIDDKIELNNSINNNLEQQAQAIFKSWFVDFEPFGGTMPNDWKVVDLGDICNISAGGDKPYNFSVKQTQEFQIPIYSNGINNEGLYGYTNYAKINNESVTISARGTIGYTCLRLNPFFPIVRLICIEPKNRLFSAKYLYQAIKRMDIVGFGTTQQQITVPYCKTLKILLPSKEYLYKYANIVDRLYKEIFENKNENIKLIQLRDTLLPKLMSGEIDVSEVDISTDKLLFSILVFEHFYIKIVILIGVTINTMTIFTSNIIKRYKLGLYN